MFRFSLSPFSHWAGALVIMVVALPFEFSLGVCCLSIHSKIQNKIKWKCFKIKWWNEHEEKLKDANTVINRKVFPSKYFIWVNCKFVYSCENLWKFQVKQTKQSHDSYFPFARVHVRFCEKNCRTQTISLSHTKQTELYQIQNFERITSSRSDMANKYIQCYTYSSAFERSFVTTFVEHFFLGLHTHTHQAHWVDVSLNVETIWNMGTHFMLRWNEKPFNWKLLVLWLQCTNKMKLAKCWLLYALCTYLENAHRPNREKG